MRNLTKEEIQIAFKALKAAESKDIKQKAMVLRFYYFSVIVCLIIIGVIILIKG